MRVRIPNAEIDSVLTDVELASTSASQPADDCPEPVARAVACLGDHWILGRHALVCGDAKDQDAVDALMAGQQADMVFTDPPYNVPIEGNVSGLGRIHHREFAEASGEMSKAGFTEFLGLTLNRAAAVCKDGAIVFVCMDWRHQGEVLAAGYEVFSELKNIKKIGGAFIYDALVSRANAQSRLIDDFLALFGGRAQPIMAHFVEAGKLTLDDVQQVERHLRELAGGKKP